MSHGHPTRRRRIVARAAPLLLALGALPLLAPTCGPGTEGVKTFARYSLVIPMDRCYQYQVAQPYDAGTSAGGVISVPGCPQAPDAGDVIKAYGLVYQLIRNGVAVHWVINPEKTAFKGANGIDLTLQYDGGAPVLTYNWATGTQGPPPTAQHAIDYIGGPFVVDGSDYAKAIEILKKYQGTFGGVNVHVTNVAFRAWVKKTLAGGWVAGGPTPPKIALLDIGSGELTKQTKKLCDPNASPPLTSGCLCNPAYPSITSCTAICTSPSDTTRNCDAEYCIGTVKNSQQVIEGYLVWAGIGGSTSCADPNNCPGGKSAGPHGQIYDRLTMADFQPAPGGDWKSSNFYKNSADGRAAQGITDGSGYQLLWVPHWTAPGSCSAPSYNDKDDVRACACLATRHTTAQIDNALKAIGAFVADGNDLFGECSGLGSFEGVLDGNQVATVKFGDAVPETHFQTTTGLQINQQAAGTPYFWPGNYASPLMQLGDYEFRPVDGAIKIYKPADAYKVEDGVPAVVRLVSNEKADTTNHTLDYFTMLPSKLDANLKPVRGSVVYLAGHTYNSNQSSDGTAQIGGSRLVLNTLFNLGAGCTESGIACDTGQLGICGKGVLSCDVNGQTYCKQLSTAKAEGCPADALPTDPCWNTCNGLDDDCDGEVDEQLETTCYEPNDATRGKGMCRDGVKVCEQRADGTYGMSACQDQIRPAPEACNNQDDDCDGQVDESLQQACYTGPDGTLAVGTCKAGLQTCTAGAWSACAVCPQPLPTDPAALAACQILPRSEICTGGSDLVEDINCDGLLPTEGGSEACGGCTPNAERPCYSGPPGSILSEPNEPTACKAGIQKCNSDGSAWGACNICPTPLPTDPEQLRKCQILPKPEVCSPTGTAPDARIDESCDGAVDEGCGCTASVECFDPPAAFPGALAGVGQCSKGTRICTDGVLAEACAGQGLPSLEVCDGEDNDCDGQVDESPDDLCSEAYTCVTGVCVPRECGVEQHCPEGFACLAEGGQPAEDGGTCHRDLCGEPKSCSTDGQCAASEHCDGGQCVCDAGLSCTFGSCVDRCNPNPCAQGAFCSNGACVGGSCYFTGCDAGFVCKEGACQPSPCDGVSCPAGTFCREGDCVQSCAFVDCPSGQKCGQDGFCEVDRCAGTTCDPGERCVNGNCQPDACAGFGCGMGQVCREKVVVEDGVTKPIPVCVDDPCSGITCPAGRCVGGQCYPAGNPASIGDGEVAASGCGCGSSGAAGALWTVLLLAVAPLARRRRAPRGGALVVVLAGVVLLGAACKKTEFDPSLCQTACPGEDRCIDLYTDPSHCGACGAACADGFTCADRQCGPANGVAPQVTGLDASAADQGQVFTLGITGRRFATGATVRAIGPGGTTTYPAGNVTDTHLQVTLDLVDAPPQELALRVVNPDRVISNEVRFDVTLPTPIVKSVVVKTAGGQTIPAPRAGIVNALVVEQTSGFLPTSRCLLEDPAKIPTYLETIPTAAGVTCTFDATQLQPAAGYVLKIENPGPVRSLPVALDLVSQTPQVFDLSPSSAQAGEVLNLTVSGDGFDRTSVVTRSGFTAPLPTTFLSARMLSVPQLAAGAAGTTQIGVRNGLAGSYVTSNTKTFTVGDSSLPSTIGLSRATAYQGDPAVSITVSGSNLPANSVLQLQPPGGDWPSTAVACGTTDPYARCATVTPGTGDVPDTATATVDLTQPAAEGFWLVRLWFPTPAPGTSSASYQLRVLSNRPVLQSATPRGAKVGTTTTVTLTATNLRPLGASADKGIRAWLANGVAPDKAFTPTSVTISAADSGTGTVVFPLNAIGLDTGTYTLQLANADGTAVADAGLGPRSNELTFNLTAGAPTIQYVCKATDPAGACARPQLHRPRTPSEPEKIAVRLTGTNFAKPDASGVGSVVHARATQLGIADYVVPAADVTVNSSTEIVVMIDTLAAIPGDPTNGISGLYDVSVWNPGGPQMSDWKPGAIEIVP